MEKQLEQEYVGQDVIQMLRDKAKREKVTVEELLRRFAGEKNLLDRLRENPNYLGGIEE